MAKRSASNLPWLLGVGGLLCLLLLWWLGVRLAIGILWIVLVPCEMLGVSADAVVRVAADLKAGDDPRCR